LRPRGESAWRATLPREAVPEVFLADETGLWLGPSSVSLRPPSLVSVRVAWSGASRTPATVRPTSRRMVRIRGIAHGREIGAIALGAAMRERFGAPYWVVHPRMRTRSGSPATRRSGRPRPRSVSTRLALGESCSLGAPCRAGTAGRRPAGPARRDRRGRHRRADRRPGATGRPGAAGSAKAYSAARRARSSQTLEAGAAVPAIVGAGIGGLTAALALAARGHAVTLVERRIAFSEVGGELQARADLAEGDAALDEGDRVAAGGERQGGGQSLKAGTAAPASSVWDDRARLAAE
jgi:hypothetical protein